MRARLLILLFASLSIAAACHRQVRAPAPAPLCTLALPEPHRRTALAALPASVWHALLIKRHEGLDAAGGRGHDLVDCAGEPLGGPPLPDACARDDGEAQLLPRAARTRALVVRHAGGPHWFAWAPVWRWADGTVEGPLAIAREGTAQGSPAQARRLEVRAIGSVRGYPERARIRVHEVAGRWVLGVEGERCEAGHRCARGVRLALFERQRFRDRPLRALSTRGCLAPAWFPLREEVTRPRGEHARDLRREQSIAYERDAIVVDEHIVVSDRDLRRVDAPARLFREAQSRLRIRPEQGELLTEGQSLWDPIRAQDGALEVEASEHAQEREAP